MSEDDILAEELGRLGAAPGAGWGARLAARLLPTVRHRLEFDLGAPPERGQEAVRAFLAAQGRELDLGPARRPCPAALGVVGAGYLGMNPAVVLAEFTPTAGGCRVALSAAAKEGLIRQRSAEGAVARLAEWLRANA